MQMAEEGGTRQQAKDHPALPGPQERIQKSPPL